MQRKATWFCVVGLLSIAACGDDGEASPLADGDADGSTDGSNDGDADGSADGAGNGGDGAADGDADGEDVNAGGCSKGAYPTQGEVTFCASAESEGCTAISEAEGYTEYYGDVVARRLSDLTPLSCAQSIGQLSVSRGEGLKDLTGLGNLSDLHQLFVVYNEELESLAGLESLQALDVLSLTANGLTDLTGLPAGLEVKLLTIESHENLTSLAGLENVTVTESLNIVDNPMLPECLAQAFAARFPDIEVDIEGNDTTAVCDEF